MRRNAFTLLEMLIAIAVFAVSITLLYEVFNTLDKKRERTLQNYKSYRKIEQIKRLMYRDLIYQKDFETKKDFYIFKTKNSLYGISDPYVAYTLKNGILYRLESNKKIDSDPTTQALSIVKILPLCKCKEFSLFQDKEGMTLYIKETNSKIIFKVPNLSSL